MHTNFCAVQGIGRWFHDSRVPPTWYVNEDTLRKVGELVRKNTNSFRSTSKTTSSLLFEQRSEVNRNQCCERLSACWKRAWQSSACVSPTETLNTDLAPIDDDIEAHREGVEIGNEEDEEPLETEVPRTRMNPKNPTSRKKTRT